MKIPSLCTWTIVADNTSCQPLWKKKCRKHHPNTNGESLGNHETIRLFFVQFLWENENHALRHKGENREVCFDTCQLTISLGTCLSILSRAILHNPWLYEIQSLRHHSMGREDQKTQAATETTNHSYICVLHQSHQSFKNKKKHLKLLVPAANYQKPNSLCKSFGQVASLPFKGWCRFFHQPLVGNQPPPSGVHQLGELATGVQPEAGIPAHTWQAVAVAVRRWRRGLGVRKSRPAVVFFFLKR